jgi:hypothetical protein
LDNKTSDDNNAASGGARHPHLTKREIAIIPGKTPQFIYRVTGAELFQLDMRLGGPNAKRRLA